jgi:hypothetical protein
MNARVVVTAAGSILAQGIIKSLKLANEKHGIKYTIIAADMSPFAAGLYRKAGKIRNAVNLFPCFIDYAVNFGMIRTEQAWRNHLIKDGSLAWPVVF